MPEEIKDALGKTLRLGQRVAIPCNSIFKIGVLYNYRPNRSKYYLEMVDYSEGNIPDDELRDWRRTYYTPERVTSEAYRYYIRFPNGKTRAMTNRLAIIGVADDAEVT